MAAVGPACELEVEYFQRYLKLRFLSHYRLEEEVAQVLLPSIDLYI